MKGNNMQYVFGSESCDKKAEKAIVIVFVCFILLFAIALTAVDLERKSQNNDINTQTTKVSEAKASEGKK